MKGHYLIDTHALLWAADATDRLSETAIDLLSNPEARIHVSMASLWEMAIKQSIGKLELADDFFRSVFDSGYLKLPVEVPHLERYLELPLHHRDPFDRLLIAQAQTENLVIITQDSAFSDYGAEIVW